MRCTKKLLMKLVDEKLKELEIPFTVQSIERSRFRGHEYEAGAWFWKAYLKSTDTSIDYKYDAILSFIPFYEIEKVINNGGGLKIINNSRYSGVSGLEDLEITTT